MRLSCRSGYTRRSLCALHRPLTWPLSVAHLFAQIASPDAYREQEGPGLEDLNEQHCEASMFFYLLAIALMAERLGLGVSTWSPEFQDALWGARASFPPNDQAKLQRRNWVAQRLG